MRDAKRVLWVELGRYANMIVVGSLRRLWSGSALEELNLSLVSLGRGAGLERAEIPALAGLWIRLARVEPVFA
jgi:hypothetical protein